MVSARSRIPDPSLNLQQGDEPANQAEVEGLFARAEVHVAGFQLKSWHFRRIPRTSSASSFPLSFWEEKSSLSGGTERVGTSRLPLQHSRRPAPPRGQKEIGFELQAWARGTGLPCASVSGELLPALRTLPLTCRPSWPRRSRPFPQCPGHHPRPAHRAFPTRERPEHKSKAFVAFSAGGTLRLPSPDPESRLLLFPLHARLRRLTPSPQQRRPACP